MGLDHVGLTFFLNSQFFKSLNITKVLNPIYNIKKARRFPGLKTIKSVGNWFETRAMEEEDII